MSTYAVLDNGIRVVDYEDSLAPALADMWNKSGSGWGGSFGDGVWDANKVINDHRGTSYFKVYIAMDGDEAVGYCSFDRYYKDPDTAYVHLLNVRPDYHGKKVGKALVLECVKETIARGLPRLDIHTWAGNTKAVPLYKKCGFLWEDRTDTTHLCNMIPTVLQTELFTDFFSHADWYADSTRVIEIVPDGVKTNRFECFGYSWASQGETLRVDFEKSGRRIRLAETEDWSLEMMADDHELAFGLDYSVNFRAVNKSGKPLNIKITGKDDGEISFPYTDSASVIDEWESVGRFTVGAIDEAFDTMRLHPCVLADVEINGKAVVFGLGIEPKFPLSITLNEKRGIAKPDLEYDLHIGIQSALPAAAEVSIKLPDNTVGGFAQKDFTFSTTPLNSVGACVRTTVKTLGHAALPVVCDIKLADGRTAQYTHMLHLIHQGIDSAFAFETEHHRGVTNGLWTLALDKRNNSVVADRITRASWIYFWYPQLGQPYDEEFNIAKASAIRTSFAGPYATMEVDLASNKFLGAVLTMVFTLSASGIITSRYKVTNSGAAPRELWLKVESFSDIARRLVFHMDGEYHELTDDLLYGFDALRPECFDEPWAFNSGPIDTCGVCWPAQYKPTVRWGDAIKFEHQTGRLNPGEAYQTEPVQFYMGLFAEAKDFRNYVMSACENEAPRTKKHLEVKLNGGNPFVVGDTLPVSVTSDRQQDWGGYIEVSSPDGAFAHARNDNVPDSPMPESAFALPLTAAPGVHIAETAMHFKGYDIAKESAFIIPNTAVAVTTERKDGVLTVSNGAVEFKSAPDFADSLFSLCYEGRDWLYSQYPEKPPYSWWNPFIGGTTSRLDRMNDSLALREKIEADFAEQRDNFGNVWKGIHSTLTIDKFDEHRGFVLNHFFITLPGAPVLCYFARLDNNTGRYRKVGIHMSGFLSGKDNINSLTATVTADDKQRYSLRFGEEAGKDFDRLAVVRRDGAYARPEILHIFKDAKRDRGKMHIGGDINHVNLYVESRAELPSGGSYSTKPVFWLFADKTLSLESLAGLENIVF